MNCREPIAPTEPMAFTDEVPGRPRPEAVLQVVDVLQQPADTAEGAWIRRFATKPVVAEKTQKETPR